MVTGQRRTGEVDGGDIRVVWMWVRWLEWFGFTVHRLGWTDCFLSSFRLWSWSLLSVSTLCVPPLLPSFSSLLCLLSCLRCRYPSIRSSLFRFSRCLVFSIPRLPLSLLCSVNGSFVIFHLRAPIHSLSSDFVLSYTSTPFQIAELLHTVHTCLVSRCNMCIS